MAGDYLHIVCSMCGDVGFPDKLFRCSNCRNRYQHSYCSNYYSEAAVNPIEKCDWCKSEEINQPNANTKHAAAVTGGSSSSSRKSNRSEYSGGKIKQQQQQKEEISSPQEKGDKKSPRTGGGTRRYKLLKDVTC